MDLYIIFASSHASLYVAFTCGVFDSWVDVNITVELCNCLYSYKYIVTFYFYFFMPYISFGGAFFMSSITLFFV